MGIDYNAGTETITVTGGSFEEPYTMAILDTDGTVGGYITAGGYGNREYTVSKHLVIGSEDDWTFFDPTRAIVKMADGYTLTVYSHALRGGNLRDSWAARKFGAEKGPIDEQDCKLRTENIIMMYVEVKGFLCPFTGELMRATGPEALTTPQALAEPMPLLEEAGQGRLVQLDGTICDPCAPASTSPVELAKLIELARLEPLPVGPEPLGPEQVGPIPLSKGPMHIVVMVQSAETVTA